MVFCELWNTFKNIILKNICDRLLLTRLYFWTFNRLVISNVVHGPAGDKRNINLLFRMAFFGTAHGWREGGGDRPTPPKNLSCIFYSDVTWYTLPKKYPKYMTCDTPLEFCWHQQFFTRNQQILLYQGIWV